MGLSFDEQRQLAEIELALSAVPKLSRLAARLPANRPRRRDRLLHATGRLVSRPWRWPWRGLIRLWRAARRARSRTVGRITIGLVLLLAMGFELMLIYGR